MEREVIAAAVRVLDSASHHKAPETKDIRVLQNFAPDLATSPPDELACEIIQNEMKKEHKAKAATASD